MEEIVAEQVLISNPQGTLSVLWVNRKQHLDLTTGRHPHKYTDLTAYLTTALCNKVMQ